MTWVTETPEIWTQHKASHRTGEAEWSGTPSWDAAVKLAEEGWPKGLEKLSRALEDTRVIAGQKPIPGLNLDVAGAFPHVPIAATGMPQCMVHPGDQSVKARPIVRIFNNVSASCGVEPQSIINRGAAVLSYVDILESIGYSVELQCLEKTGSGNMTHQTWVTCKQAGEPLELDRLAFLFIHPSYLRRIIFACNERTPRAHEESWGHGYGMPMDLSKEEMDPGAIYFGASPGRTEFATLEKAMEFVGKAIGASIDLSASNEARDQQKK